MNKMYSTAVMLMLMVASLNAQKLKDVVINPIQVTDNMYMLLGGGGNIGLFVGPDGSLMIDDQFADLAPKIKRVVDSLSQSEVKYLINTHWHGDHTGGNEAFADYVGAIIAHDKVRERLSTDQIRPFGRSTKASPQKAWPTQTFSDQMKIYFNDEEIHLIHHHGAHTDGDAFVYFVKANVLHMGDCFFRSRFPYVDTKSGGSPDGLLSAVEGALMLVDDDTKIIPGHGALSTKADLKSYHDMLVTVTERAKGKVAEGLTLDEIRVEEVTEGYAAWGDGFISGEKFVKMLVEYYLEK